MICRSSIDFLRHGPVEGAEARLYVSDRQVEFGGGECSRDRGVGVAVHQDPVGVKALQRYLETLQHPSGLLAVWAASHLEVDRRIRKVETLEEGLRHQGVVVLSGVDDRVIDAHID